MKIRSSGCIIGARAIQGEESKQHPTLTSEQTLTAPPQQEGTEAQNKVTHSRTSGRKRKQPATRGDDCLWIADLMTRV